MASHSFFLMRPHSMGVLSVMNMERKDLKSRKKGGRPIKAEKRNQLLSLKCTLAERDLIRTKANSARLSISEYLRELALTGKIDMRMKALPSEILSITAMLNHMAANLNQIARKRNSNDELTVIERADLKVQSMRLKELAGEVKTYFL